MSIISRGFAGLSGDAAHSMFAFAENPWVGLSVGVLGTVLIQSSTTTTAIAVTAVGAGALPIRAAIPIIIGANLGTTVTPTLVALTFVGSRTEFRRALGGLSGTLGPLFTVVIGALLILASVYFLGKLCLPRFDSEPLFCGLLDRDRGGHFTGLPRTG